MTSGLGPSTHHYRSNSLFPPTLPQPSRNTPQPSRIQALASPAPPPHHPSVTLPDGETMIFDITLVAFSSLYLKCCITEGAEDGTQITCWENAIKIVKNSKLASLPIKTNFIQNILKDPLIPQYLEKTQLITDMFDTLTQEQKKRIYEKLALNIIIQCERLELKPGDFQLDKKLDKVLEKTLSPYLKVAIKKKGIPLNTTYLNHAKKSFLVFSSICFLLQQDYSFLASRNSYTSLISIILVFASVSLYLLTQNKASDIQIEKPLIISSAKALAQKLKEHRQPIDSFMAVVLSIPHDNTCRPVFPERRSGDTYPYIKANSWRYKPEIQHTESEFVLPWYLTTMFNCLIDQTAELDIHHPGDAQDILNFQTEDMMYYLLLNVLNRLKSDFWNDLKETIPSDSPFSCEALVTTMIAQYLENKPEYDTFLNHPFFKIQIQPYLNKVLSHQSGVQKIEALQESCLAYNQFLDTLRTLPCELDESRFDSTIEIIVTELLKGVNDVYNKFTPDHKRFDRYRIVSFLLTSKILSSLKDEDIHLVCFHLVNLSLSQHVDHGEIKKGLLSSQNTAAMTHAHYLALYFQDQLTSFCMKLKDLPSSDDSQQGLTIKSFLRELFTYLNDAKKDYQNLRNSSISKDEALKNFPAFQKFDELHHLMVTTFRKTLDSIADAKEFEKDIERFTNLLIQNTEMLKMFFQIYFYLKEMRNIELLEKWFNDVDLLDEITGPALTIVPVTFALLGLRSSTQLLVHILELLGINYQDIRPDDREKLMEFYQKDNTLMDYFNETHDGRTPRASFDNFLLENAQDASLNIFHFVNEVKEWLASHDETSKLKSIQTNLDPVNSVFDHAIALYEANLQTNYAKYGSLLDTQAIIDTLLKQVKNVQEMYYKFLNVKLKKKLPGLSPH